MRRMGQLKLGLLLAVAVCMVLTPAARGAEPPGQSSACRRTRGFTRSRLPRSSSAQRRAARAHDHEHRRSSGIRTSLTQYGAGWRGGEYLYAASLWVGAIAPDNLPYVSTGAYDTELRPSLDPVDTIYPAYEGINHGNRPGFSTRPDDDGDGEVDEDPLNGKDDDGDGRIDEDYAAISQQMFSCEYWDYTEEAINTYPEHRPLNLRVHQESYAWSTEGSNEFVGFDFKIFNDGFEVLRSVYLGFFVDSDVGPKDRPGSSGRQG